MPEFISLLMKLKRFVVYAEYHFPRIFLFCFQQNFGFVIFENPEVARKLIEQEHVMYNDTIRLNIEPKTRGYPANNNGGGNFNNGLQGSGRSSNYPPRGGGRGGGRGTYRGSNSRRGGGQFNNNSGSFSGGDENSNEYRTNKAQA